MNHHARLLLATTVAALAAPALAAPDAQAAPAIATAALQAAASPVGPFDIVVTARRREERAQDVPIALTALSGEALVRTGAFSIAQVAQQTPTLQFLSSNPRNTALTIRGLGVSYGLANDGLEQGVGFYVDGVYNSRPAVATLDLADVDRIEVLRGPQGTLFGKNTTAGAINVTTRAPSFKPELDLEGSFGTKNFVQAKASASTPLIDDILAARVSFAITRRDGLIYDTATQRHVNALDNRTIRGQLLFTPTEKLSFRLIGDVTNQDPDCCTQLYVRAGATLKPAVQQYAALAAGRGYAPPSIDPYDRLADANSPIQAKQKLGGVSLTGEYDFGDVALTSITAWRFWNWKPLNDRDYTALSILTASQNPVQQDQYSQELRLGSTGKQVIEWTVGLYAYHQKLKGQNLTAYGRDAAYWLLRGAPTGNAATDAANFAAVPDALLDGYVSSAQATSHIDSYAGFAQATWHLTETLSITPGLRYTYEKKDAVYDQQVAGGLANPTAAQLTRRLSIARPQSYAVDFNDDALTGQVSAAWAPAKDVLVYANYARGFKSGGINLAGLPFNAANLPALNRAVVSPEKSQSYELGLKTQLLDRRVTANFAIFRNDVRDFQANVVDTGPGALRGYIANVAKVRSQGAEVDISIVPVGGFSAYARGAYTDADYRSFANAPCPLELIGASTTQCDLSGRPLPGTSKYAASFGGEYRIGAGRGDAYVGGEASYRSSFYADASDSQYGKIAGYTIVNLRAGYASEAGWEAFAWVRNAFDKKYLQLLQVQSGNSGLVTGIPGDQRTGGITLRFKYRG